MLERSDDHAQLTLPEGWERLDANGVDDAIAESSPQWSGRANIVVRTYPWAGTLVDLSFLLARDLTGVKNDTVAMPLAIEQATWRNRPARVQRFVVVSLLHTMLQERLVAVHDGYAIEVTLTTPPEMVTSRESVMLAAQLATWEPPTSDSGDSQAEEPTFHAPREALASSALGADLENLSELHRLFEWLPGGMVVHAPAAEYLRNLNPAKPTAPPDAIREELDRGGAFDENGHLHEGLLELLATLDLSVPGVEGTLVGRHRRSTLSVHTGNDHFAAVHGPTLRQIAAAPDGVEAESSRFLQLSPFHLTALLIDWIGVGPTWATRDFFADVDEVALARRLQSASEPVPEGADPWLRDAWTREWVRWSIAFSLDETPTFAGVTISGVGSFGFDGSQLHVLDGRSAWDLFLPLVSQLVAAGFVLPPGDGTPE